MQMEFLVGIAIILAASGFIGLLIRKPPPIAAESPRSPTDSSAVRPWRDPYLYCPLQKTPGQGRTGIAFNDRGGLLTDIDIKDLVDALTGAPLQLKAGLFQCRRCCVFYQEQSVEVIRAENGDHVPACS